jgi:2-polyprenyl-6-methoxyphenol hydroxylase-like FAD-dependent oxidoreductase
MRVAINGCGIAGPTLAYWLLRSGHEPVLIEEAPRLRSSGYVIDFWGIGYDIAEKMGLISRLKDIGYQVGQVRFVDARGRTAASFATDVFQRTTHGRFTSLRRSDLSAALFSTVEGKVETLFGDSIAAIEEQKGSVRVTFERAVPRTFDLVVGADGLHSRVRHLAFGPEEQFEMPLGYHVAAFEAKGYRPRDDLVYVSHAQPGRQISRFSMRDDRTLFLFVFDDAQLQGANPTRNAERKKELHRIFGKDGWESPHILARLDDAGEVYFDRVSQIRMETWARGRTVLLGDAAACVSLLAGEGTGLAIAEAYVLAGELARAKGDHDTAFAGYQARLMPFLQRKQDAARKFASSFVPRSALGLMVRNLAVSMFRFPFVADRLLGRDLRHDVKLPDYSWH